MLYQLYGFLLGCCSSLAIWYFTTILLTPKIKVCRQIAKENQPGGKSKYRLKIINQSRYREAYGIQIYCRILYRNTYLTIKAPEIPVLYCRRSVKTSWSHERFVPINPMGIRNSKIEGFNNDDLLRKYKAGNLSLEDFYGDDTYFEVVLIAHDKFSGARKFVVSLSYNSEELKNAIVEGIFEDGKDFITIPRTPHTANE